MTIAMLLRNTIRAAEMQRQQIVGAEATLR